MATAALTCSSRGVLTLARNADAGRGRVIGASLDVIFQKKHDLSRGLGAALHLVSSKDPGERSLVRQCEGVKIGRAERLHRLVADAAVKDVVQQQVENLVVQKSQLKEFLEDLKRVGRVRLIVSTGVAFLESVTSLDKLYFHDVPGKGEYANVMSRDDNVDFHLLLDKVASARLVRGKTSRGDITTHLVKFVDINGSAAVSVLVMWKPGTDGEYDPGQVEAFQALEEKYGEEAKFTI